MDFILNTDTLYYIFQFIDPNEIMFVSETCKTFNKLIDKKTFPNDSILYSSIHFLKWAICHQYKVRKTNMFRKAIKYGKGEIEILQYLNDNICNSYKYLNAPLFIYAIEKESIDILNWLKKSKCLYNDLIFNLCIPDKFHKWMITNLVFNLDQLRNVIKSENIDEIMWVIKSIPFLSEHVCDMASECNSTKILEWAVNNNLKYGEITCSNAALNGNLEMLQFLRKNECAWNSWTISEAASNGHDHVIKWCLQNNCDVDEYASYEAVINNHPNTLKLLMEHNCPIDHKIYEIFCKK